MGGSSHTVTYHTRGEPLVHTYEPNISREEIVARSREAAVARRNGFLDEDVTYPTTPADPLPGPAKLLMRLAAVVGAYWFGHLLGALLS